MIDSDWTLAQIALQLLTEERLGRRLREALGTENEQYAAAKKALGG